MTILKCFPPGIYDDIDDEDCDAVCLAGTKKQIKTYNQINWQLALIFRSIIRLNWRCQQTSSVSITSTHNFLFLFFINISKLICETKIYLLNVRHFLCLPNNTIKREWDSVGGKNHVHMWNKLVKFQFMSAMQLIELTNWRMQRTECAPRTENGERDARLVRWLRNESADIVLHTYWSKHSTQINEHFELAAAI